MDIFEQVIPQTGDMVGRYRIVGELGRGGFGVVYRARQEGLEVDAAIKVMIPQATQQSARMQLYERFEQEANVMKRLEHPAAVKVRDFGRTDKGLPYLVTEFVRGKTLDAVLREAPLTVDRAIRVAKQVLGCLAEAHHLGIVHRDLKPANIMLRDIFGEADAVKVLDFGIAKVMADDGQVRTETGMRFGTPWYMAPEQARGEKEVDGRLDLYAFGLILAECLTGRRVVEAGELVAALMVQANAAPLAFESAVTSSPLFPVIDRSTRKDPNERYANAVAMREAVDEVAFRMRAGGGLASSQDTALSSTPVETPASRPLPSGQGSVSSPGVAVVSGGDTLAAHVEHGPPTRRMPWVIIALVAIGLGAFVLVAALSGGDGSSGLSERDTDEGAGERAESADAGELGSEAGARGPTAAVEPPDASVDPPDASVGSSGGSADSPVVALLDDLRANRSRVFSNEIIIAGQPFQLGHDISVINSRDAGSGWDFASSSVEDHMGRRAYTERPGLDGWALRPSDEVLEQLAERVSQIVIHDDAATTAMAAFDTQATRALSSHFFIAPSGGIIQGLDPVHAAFHAGSVNSGSVAIVLNNVARVEGNQRAFADPVFGGQIDYTTREVVDGVINGEAQQSFAYTDAQYESLCALLNVLTEALEVPRRMPAADGEVLLTAVDNPAVLNGLFGHFHVDTAKWDPGPGFDWERVRECTGALYLEPGAEWPAVEDQDEAEVEEVGSVGDEEVDPDPEPERREARLRLGNPSIAGFFHAEILRRVVREHSRELRRCYERELDADPDLEGELVVAFTIDMAGNVARASVTEDSLGNDAVGSCVTRTVRRWVFPQPDGGIVNVRYPLEFEYE